MADLGSFDAPLRDAPEEHTITVCGEQFIVQPRFDALQSVQWAKAVRSEDGMAIGSHTADILTHSMDKDTYARFEKVVAEHAVGYDVLAQIADALITAAMQGTSTQETPTTSPQSSSTGQRPTPKKSKAGSSLQAERDRRWRADGMVPITESKVVSVS